MKCTYIVKAILGWFYLFLLFFYLVSQFLFSTQLVLFGNVILREIFILFQIIFVGIILLIYFGIKRLHKFGFWLGIFFHFIFLINNLSIFFKVKPFIVIKGIKETGHFLVTPILAAGIVINLAFIFAIFYVYKPNKCF